MAENANNGSVTCAICKQTFNPLDVYPLELSQTTLFDFMKHKYPDISRTSDVCMKDYHEERLENLKEFLEMDQKIPSEDVAEILESFREDDFISENINDLEEERLTFGQRVSDKVSAFGGSWVFIICFFVFIIGWMIVNTILIFVRTPYDPYPFIFLNLILSCLAAVQAPIIMMSQNRREEKDRIRAENDYKVNLKAEIQIRQLHAKLDETMRRQWHQLEKIEKVLRV